METININIGRKTVFVFSLVVLIFAGAFVVFAYGGNNPSEMGHSAEELEGIMFDSTLVDPIVVYHGEGDEYGEIEGIWDVTAEPSIPDDAEEILVYTQLRNSGDDAAIIRYNFFGWHMISQLPEVDDSEKDYANTITWLPLRDGEFRWECDLGMDDYRRCTIKIMGYRA